MTNKLLGSAPLFFVTDIHKSVDYYCNVLGFTNTGLWGDPAFFSMPRRDNMIVMLQETESKQVNNNEKSWDAYFWVEDADALFTEFTDKGVIIDYPPEHKEAYGCYEFAIKDPDGYTLAFGQEVGTSQFDQYADAQETIFKFTSPVLASENVARDAAWYEKNVGFENVYNSTNYQEGPMDYAVLKKHNQLIHLQFQFPKDMTSTDLKFEVQNLAYIQQQLLEQKVITKKNVYPNTAWETNEIRFFDPSGNRITILESI
ncbi:VOC family protein [Flavobacteriaceae bacterium S356]|uniref:VOC family protein n=1 Tax=Asprobacillus argus TaxID=3076534 RepID=A0ABU3LGD8_9FLAO|nr:VOC family protein [Flavobacteriaceae bacterium S356]